MSTPLSSLPPPTIGDTPLQPQFNNNSNIYQQGQQYNPLLPPAQNLPPNSSPGMDNSQLIDDILADIGEPPSMDNSNIDSQIFSRSMDESQVPPEKKYNRQNQNKDLIYEDDEPNMTYNDSIVMKAIGVSGDSTIGKTYNHLKLPLVVFLICFLISLPRANRLLFSMMPSLLLESGQVSLQGVLIKAVLGLVLYYLVSLIL